MSGALSPTDFPNFFKAVHGVEPFAWQARLAAEVAQDGRWPGVLDVPTGAGKTAAIDIAVFHLALQASAGAARTAPVRIAFVVDRRIIVDDAYARALKLAEVLADPAAAPVVRSVAGALGHLAEDGARPLLVRRLRGGVPREPDWARTPAQPTVLLSTVDQVGSRLLFRGYGISERMAPVHAGLLGADCLILLDEAHLSEPFRQTLAAIATYYREPKPDAPVTSPFGFALLSATPGETGVGALVEAKERFRLKEVERQDERLGPRLKASKAAQLREIAGERGVDTDLSRTRALLSAVEDALNAFASPPTGVKLLSTPAIAVIVNRVARARRAFDALREAHPRAKVQLVIGPARGVDRERITAELDPVRTRVCNGEVWRERLNQPFIVVATQTLEVGADLDFDGLVTEPASLDALRQRFGRLNRVGREGLVPFAAIVAQKPDVTAKAEDPVYGAALRDTWRALNSWRNAQACVDFGSDAMADLDRRPLPESLSLRDLIAPRPDAPTLMPAYVDLFAQTSPPPNSGPDPALFLHGPARPAGVQIVWRDDLEIERGATAATDLLALLPPRSAEAVEVSLAAARAWLDGRRPPDLADAPEVELDEEAPAAGLAAVRWIGGAEPRAELVFARRLRPGDLLIVPAVYRGCDDHGWAPDQPEDERVADVADLAAGPYSRRRFALRLTPARLEAERAAARRRLGRSDDTEALQAELDVIDMVAERLTDFLNGQREPLSGVSAGVCLGELLKEPEPPQTSDPCSLGRRLRAFSGRTELHFPYSLGEEGRPTGLVLLAPKGVALGAPRLTADGQPATEDDVLGLGGEPQGLVDHSEQVRDHATDYARRLGLPGRVIKAVRLAAYAHDAGKADMRFQRLMHGSRWSGGGLLAKSGGRSALGAWERASLPKGWRHEVLSVRMAMATLPSESDYDAGLALWLIGAHHGLGRPFFPHEDEAEDHQRRFEAVDSLVPEALQPGPGPQRLGFAIAGPAFDASPYAGMDWAELFVDLQGRYGAWELARLEALVRLADHRASETGRAPS